MQTRKIIAFVLTLVFSIGLCSGMNSPTANAHHTGGTYPKSVASKSDLQNMSFIVYIFDNATDTWNFMSMDGSDQLATGYYVYEHASYSDSNDLLYTNYVITSTDYLDAFTNMRNDMGPITVLSGFRDPYHNRSIGPSAALYSHHVTGMALDPATPCGDEDDWELLAETDWGFEYAYTKNCAIHADTRTTGSGFATLYVNDENPYVFTMELAAHYHGYSVLETGYYSTIDEDEIETFQTDHGLTSDGVVGSNTWSKLMNGDTHTPW